MLLKVLYSICQQIYKTQQWRKDQKRLVCIPIPKEGNAKKCSNYCTMALISHASKVMLKESSSWASTVHNRELPDVQVGLKKAEEPEIKLEKTPESPLNKIEPVYPKGNQS